MELPDAVEAFVRDERVGRLATVDGDGRPHLVPVCFAYEAGVVYTVLDAKPKRVPVGELRRVRNLAANPNVQLLLDRYDEDWSRLGYVQLRGRATLLRSGPEQASAVRLLREKYPQYATMDIEASPVIRVEIVAVVSWGDLT